MGKLIFIGMGLHDERGIALQGLEAAKECDLLFMETYTSLMPGADAQRMESLYGKGIEMLSRSAVEDGAAILDAAKDKEVGLLIPGDPMSATTHIDMRLRAERLGIRTWVVPGVSALTAVPSLLGLQHYKFGRVATVPFWAEHYRPTSFYDVVRSNLEMGMHSLLLLDVQAEQGRWMSAGEGFDILVEVERSRRGGIFVPERLVCVVARACAPDALLRAGDLAGMRGEDFGPPPHSIVIPGKLHFMEAEALEIFARAPREMLEEG
ncbi:MAG: diphthine synthase [Candidatus Thermoplasmatota archaeon]